MNTAKAFDVVHTGPTPMIQPKKRKIAIMGTAPQWQLAPFDDPEWEIWGIFGLVGCGKRLDRVFELHDKAIIEKMAAETQAKNYWETVAKLGDKFITKDAYDQAPNAVRFDFESKVKKYGPYFASSASWLIAEAIDQGATSIGMWGINMADKTEYAHQKPSCTYLLGYARAKGIEIVLPRSSELLCVSHQYGLEKPPAALEGFAQKRAEIMQNLSAHANNKRASEMGEYGAQQALAVVDWFEQNWR